MNEEKKKTSGFRKAWIAFLVVCALAVAVFSAIRIFTKKEEVAVKPLSTVSTFFPEKGNIEVETSLVATKMPGDIYYVIPMTAGEVTEIYVKTGDRVKKGDKICKIDNKKQVDAAKIQLDSAQVQINTLNDSIALAKTNLDRMAALYQTGDISAQSYEQVKASYDQAMAGMEGAKLQYNAAQLQYDTQVEFGTVTAPADGVIESTNMTLNNMAAQTSQVAVISGNGSGKLQFNVTDRLLASVKKGDRIRAEKQGTEYQAEITQVAKFPGQTTGLYLVEAEIDDQGAIPTGSSVKVHFVSEKCEDSLIIPTDCIYYDGGHTYVYTVSYDTEGVEQASVLSGNTPANVHKIEVVTGIANSELTEIKEGISENDELIGTWTSQLYEGAHVQVLGGGAQ